MKFKTSEEDRKEWRQILDGIKGYKGVDEAMIESLLDDLDGLLLENKKLRQALARKGSLSLEASR